MKTTNKPIPRTTTGKAKNYKPVEQGAGVATMDTNGRFINIVGVTAGAGKMWKTGTTLGTAAGGLRCRIAGTDYWLPFYAAEPT